MYVTPEQIQAANKATVEALLAVANTQFTALEKLATIQASAVKSAFEDSVANTRALLGAKDVQEFVTLQNSFTQPPSRRPSPTRRACTKSRPRRMPSCRKWRSAASPNGMRTS